MSGKVYLVGAGPGDPELLTRKAWRVLQIADVVLHDELVSAEILRLLPAAAQVVNVGKRCGAKGISQPEINQRMIAAARQGRIVARLKSGDPLLFGRAGEEIEALREADVEFEVIPGVTAALGAAAAAGFSLTHRRHASRVVFLTAHRAGGAGLSPESNDPRHTTYVIYMPGHCYAELAAEFEAAGLAANVPCVIVSRATTPEQRILRTTLGKLPECSVAAAPSLLVVGEAVGAVDREEAHEGEVPNTLREEILNLALQHPFHEDVLGGQSVE